ncbi:MAG: hypothetical protein EBU90_13035 [Proteobacteria bacterium]|nr:hypothetical protein [Pseudomonadota bacterium]NBP15487.1 hypothetical protein [bacterium]
MRSIYYSWWSKAHDDRHDFNFKNKNKLVELFKKSVFLARKIYPKSEIILITDSEGANLFKEHFIFNRIIPLLDDLSINYRFIWCLGKIKAYEFAAEYGKPFVHLDNDFFMSGRLKNNIERSELIAQSIDLPYRTDDYMNVPAFLKLTKKRPNFILELKDLNIELDGLKRNGIYNMGIFGGQNTNLIKEYSSEVINMVLDKDNSDYFLTQETNLFEKSCLTEQYSFGSFCRFNNIKPALLMNKSHSFAWEAMDYTLEKCNFVHMQGALKDQSDKWFNECLLKINGKPKERPAWPPKRK